LTATARTCYEEEITRRGLGMTDDTPEVESSWEEEHYSEEFTTSDYETGDKPPWLEHAEIACSFSALPGQHNTPELEEARNVLEHSRIPCYVAVPEDPATGKPMDSFDLMVPSAFYLEAVGLLDKEIFNPELESTWRTHFSTLSDRELRDIKPKSLVTGLLDRAERLTKAYNDEMTARKLRSDAAEDDGTPGSGS
jgi:hypothetical protein